MLAESWINTNDNADRVSQVEGDDGSKSTPDSCPLIIVDNDNSFYEAAIASIQQLRALRKQHPTTSTVSKPHHIDIM